MPLFKKRNKAVISENSDWDNIKNNFYWDPGDLPDIIIENCNIDDWRIFVDFVNENYRVQFKLYADQSITEKINFETIKEFWDGKLEDGCMASVFIDHIQLNIFVYSQNEIDLDFDRREIKNIEDHNKLINYLKDICSLLDKEAAIYAEGSEKILLARISKNDVKYYNK